MATTFGHILGNSTTSTPTNWHTTSQMDRVKIAELKSPAADVVRKFVEDQHGKFTFTELGDGVGRCIDRDLGRTALNDLVGCFVSEFWSPDLLDANGQVKGDLRFDLFRFRTPVDIFLPEGLLWDFIPVWNDLRINGEYVRQGHYRHVTGRLMVEQTMKDVVEYVAIGFNLPDQPPDDPQPAWREDDLGWRLT